MSISLQKSPKRTNIKHNNREMSEKEKLKNTHIDYSKSNQNRYFKKVLKELYEEEFGEALQKYNDKQKRADRKIKNYYEHIKGSKKTFVQQEMIIQIGDKDDFASADNRQLAKEVLVEWVNGFKIRNPQMKVYNIALHDDEASPHIHLNFVPIADGYKRGLEKQVSFDKAMLQQNPNLNKVRPFADWRDGEVAVLEKILAERGIARKEVGTNNYKDVNEYKEKKDLEKELEKKIETLNQNVNDVQTKLEGVTFELDQRIAAKEKVISEFEEFKKGVEDKKNSLIEQAIQDSDNQIEQMRIQREKEEERLKKESEKRLSEVQSRVDRLEEMENQKIYNLNHTLERAQEFWNNYNKSVRETELVKSVVEPSNEFSDGKVVQYVKMPLTAYETLLTKAEGYNNAFLELDRVSSENSQLKDENKSLEVKYDKLVDYDIGLQNHVKKMDSEYNHMRNFITEKILVKEYNGYKRTLMEKVAKEQKNRQNTSPVANKKKSPPKDNGLEL